jgi:MoaA/NifB/PqqE/SkfB family radical SAM enzyme
MKLRKGTALSPTKYIAAVRKLFGPKKDFYISGGEPTIWPGLVELCKEILASGAKIVVQTNGTKPEMVRKLLSIGVTDFNLSIDGPESVHNSIRGTGSYRLMCETVAAISSSSKGRYVTTTVLCSYNLASVEGIFASFRQNKIAPSVMIFELARIFDFNAVRISANMAGCKIQEVAVKEVPSRSFSFSLEELKKVVAGLKRLSSSYRRKIMFLPDQLPQQLKLYYNYQTRKGKKVSCRHRGTLRIDSQANVNPCFTFRNSLGNILLDDWKIIARKSELFWDKLEENNLAPVCETCFRLTEAQQ